MGGAVRNGSRLISNITVLNLVTYLIHVLLNCILGYRIYFVTEVGANPVLQSEDAASDNLKQVEDNVLQADKQSLLISDIHNVSDTLLPVDKSANTKESTTLNCRRSSRTKRVSAKFSSNEFVSDIDIRKSYAETEDISDNPLEGSETSLTSENQHLDSVTSKAHINYMNRKGNKVKRLKTHTGTRKPKSVNSGKKQKPVNKSAVCPTCGKVGTPGMVKYHRQVHAGDAKFLCEVCDKLYYTKEALRVRVIMLSHSFSGGGQLLCSFIISHIQCLSCFYF